MYVHTWDIIIFFINIFRFWCFTIQHYKKKFGAEFSLHKSREKPQDKIKYIAHR